MILHKRAGGEEREKGTYPYEPHHEDEDFDHGDGDMASIMRGL